MNRAERIRAGARPSTIRKNRKPSVRRSKSLTPLSWMGKMKDIPCFILGNAPSLNKIEDMSILDDYLTVGINRIFFKYDPTILIWQDLALWSQERQHVLDTKAIKYCQFRRSIY